MNTLTPLSLATTNHLAADFLGWHDDFNLHRGHVRAAPPPPSALLGLPRGTDVRLQNPRPRLLISPFLLSWPRLCAGAVRWPGSAH